MFLQALAAIAAITVYVSPNGEDTASGAAGSPVRTLERARDVLRAQRGGQGLTALPGGAEVVLEDGVYAPDHPLELGRDDGGKDGQPVVWRARNRGKAIVTGRLSLKSWRKMKDHIWVADIPGDAPLPSFLCGGNGVRAQLAETTISLFCDGKRLPQSRWPNDEYARTGLNVYTVNGRTVGKREWSHDAEFCRSGIFEFANPRMTRWAKEPDLWAFGLWVYEWADATVKVKSIDAAAGQIAVDPEPLGFGIKEGGQFKLMNAISEIDEPGEWALDRATRRVYCWLPHEGAEVSVAFAPGLVRVVGATNLNFQDLVFECSRKTAITLARCVGCTISGSTIRHTSSWGVEVRDGKADKVVGCDLHDLGEGGILLLGGNLDTLEPGRHEADNNHIHHYGNVIPNYRPGVQLLGVGNRATHNLIHHTRHQALAFGGNDHYLGYNICHDCCMFNNDAGTIYCCQRDWRCRGTVIEQNLVHMTGKQPRGTHTEAIYLDDFSSGTIVRYNLINRATLGVYIGGGQDCEVYGNLAMNCTHGIRLGSRGIETFAKQTSLKGFDSIMFRNLNRTLGGPNAALFRRRYPKMAKVLEFADGQAAHNAHWNVITNNVSVGCRSNEFDNWSKVASTCTATNNLETDDDPGLADYYGLDWSFRPGSELARRLGDIRFREMGLYESPLRASPAVRYGEGVTKPRPFGMEYDLATVRVDMQFYGEMPAGVTAVATNLTSCNLPDWGRNRRVVADFGQASLKEWREYSFTFTPEVTGRFDVITMGMRGEKTLYDDFRVSGAKFANGGFEGEGGWTFPKTLNKNDHRYKLCNTQKPWGIVTAEESGVPAAEGTRAWCGSDMIGATQSMTCTAGVPVTISFKARAASLDD